MIYDYLIVGQGLAGTVLTHTLLNAGKTVYVVDTKGFNRASAVAGGLYNPITGRKMVKTWNADHIFPVIEGFYLALERKLGSKFLHTLGIYRPFLDFEEQNEWQGKIPSPGFSSFIEKVFTHPLTDVSLNNNYGGLLLKNAGYVDTGVLIEANKKFLKNKGLYEEMVFHEDQLIVRNDHYKIGDLRFQKLIFCTGYNPGSNTSFRWLPFRPVKGEIAEVEVENDFGFIPNRGVFMLPVAKGMSRVGSTYNWKEIDDIPTELGRKEIEEKLRLLYPRKFSIGKMKAGVRPATKDRRPFIGLHPENTNIGVFNGFGSKGVSLTPYYARQFVDHLEKGLALDKEVDINRYFS